MIWKQEWRYFILMQWGMGGKEGTHNKKKFLNTFYRLQSPDWIVNSTSCGVKPRGDPIYVFSEFNLKTR